MTGSASCSARATTLADVVPDGPPPADETRDAIIPSSVPGGRAPHLWLDDKRTSGSSLFDRLGRYFTLVRFGGPDTAPLEAAARRTGMPLTVLDIMHAQASKLYPRRMALVRPDQHIAWRGDQLPQDVDALVARVIGR